VAQGLIRRNIELCHAAENTVLIRQNGTQLAACGGAGSDLVFLDPPYGMGLGEKALAAAITGGWLAPDALVIWEEASEMDAPKGLTKLDARRYGDTFVTVLTFAAP